MMDVDFQLAQQIQTEEQTQLSIEEKSKLFVELLEKRKKHFIALRAQEKRSKPPTKAQKRNTMSTYLKNMAGYKHNQLLSKAVKTKVEGSSKRAGDKLEQEKAKKQKGDDDQEEAKMKRHIEIVKDDEVAIVAIPLATKPLVIVKYQIDKDGRMGYFKLIWADGSSKRFRNLHIFMLVEKRYPLTPITISNMLNKKLQADRWNEMCYQLLKLMTKQEKGQWSV
ncbi:hypothetical protein Tco_0066191 [Tanacetum coccineum]